MTTSRKSIKAGLVQGLMAAAGQKLPTSSFGRLGRTAFAVLSSGRMIARGNRNKNGDGEIDLEKLTKMVTAVGRLKGIAMKMGQIMSYIDIAMPDELRDALSVLQTHAQPMPFERVEQLVSAALGEKAPQLLDKMEQTPISAASIGQVHRSTLADGRVVAVKIQYPEVADAISADFGPAAIGTRFAALFYPNARIDDFIKEARERFLEECDYLHEAHCQNQFAFHYRNHPVLWVPDVVQEFCADQVLTTRFVEGLSFDDYLAANPSPAERNRIGEALFEFYLGSLFRYQLYNCDPHPGNYLFVDDGRIAMLDHGCTRQFEPKFVAKLANLTRAVHSGKQASIHRALVGLNIVKEGKSYSFETILQLLRSFYGPMLVDRESEIDLSSAMEMREAIQKKQQLLKFSLPGEFLFLFRIRFGLMSVLAKLNARANWHRLEKKYVTEFVEAHPILCDRD